jgi:hypothetical protein
VDLEKEEPEMHNPRLPLAALLPAIVLASVSAALTAQERIPIEGEKIPDPVHKPVGPDGRRLDPKLVKDVQQQFGPSHFDHPVHLKDRNDLANYKPVEIHWEADPTGKALYAPYRIDGDQRIGLKQSDISDLYKSGENVLHTGPGTQDRAWHKFFISKFPAATIIHERESANQNQADLHWATEVARRPVDPAKTVIYNATPQQRESLLFASEKARMRIGGEAEGWAGLNDEIAKRSIGFPPARVATRQALLNELATGTSNLILVYAHFDGATLHMPDAAGRQGVGITLDDINALADRPDARDRVIVLVACSTGKATAGDSSLVSLLLKKRLARAVLATALPYDAQRIPAFLQSLSAGDPPSKADPQLRPYVELDQEKILNGQPLGRHPKTEVTFNG